MPVERIPGRALARPRLPHHLLGGLAVDGPVQSLAVDAHRGGDDDALDRIVDKLLEQHCRAVIIDRNIAVDRVHALADADLGGQMHDLVDAFERLEERGLVADIADDDLGIGIKAVRARTRAVHLLDHAVENAHLVPAGE